MKENSWEKNLETVFLTMNKRLYFTFIIFFSILFISDGFFKAFDTPNDKVPAYLTMASQLFLNFILTIFLIKIKTKRGGDIVFILILCTICIVSLLLSYKYADEY